jgi:hypothetical protein
MDPLNGIFESLLKQLRLEEKLLFTSANGETFIMNYVTRIYFHGRVEILKNLNGGCPRVRKKFHRPVKSYKNNFFHDKFPDTILFNDLGDINGNPMHWHYRIIFSSWIQEETRNKIVKWWQMQPILSDDSELYLVVNQNLDEI